MCLKKLKNMLYDCMKYEMGKWGIVFILKVCNTSIINYFLFFSSRPTALLKKRKNLATTNTKHKTTKLLLNSIPMPFPYAPIRLPTMAIARPAT